MLGVGDRKFVLTAGTEVGADGLVEYRGRTDPMFPGDGLATIRIKILSATGNRRRRDRGRPLDRLPSGLVLTPAARRWSAPP